MTAARREDAVRCGSRIVMDRMEFECEKPLNHGGEHWQTFYGHRAGGMAWSDFSPVYFGRHSQPGHEAGDGERL